MPSTITLTKPTNTLLTLLTQQKYVSDDIVFSINAQTDNPAFSGGTVSGAANIATQNLTLSATNTSGVKITPTGTASRSDITYSSNVNGWIEKTSGEQALSSTSISYTETPQYISEVMIDASKSFTIKVPANNIALVGTAQIDISTVGDYSVFGFTVNTNGVTTITGLADADGVSY